MKSENILSLAREVHYIVFTQLPLNPLYCTLTFFYIKLGTFAGMRHSVVALEILLGCYLHVLYKYEIKQLVTGNMLSSKLKSCGK